MSFGMGMLCGGLSAATALGSEATLARLPEALVGLVLGGLFGAIFGFAITWTVGALGLSRSSIVGSGVIGASLGVVPLLLTIVMNARITERDGAASALLAICGVICGIASAGIERQLLQNHTRIVEPSMRP
jgi:hypothetical protein